MKEEVKIKIDATLLEGSLVVPACSEDKALPTPDQSGVASNEGSPDIPTVGPEPKVVEDSMTKIAAHSDSSSCWSAIRGRVYDLTSWIPQHPGGPDKILKLCGKDGTEAFANQHGGSAEQETQLEKLYIGELGR